MEQDKSFDECMRRQQEIVANNPRLKAYVDSGDCLQSSKLASMAYLLVSIADSYIQDVFDILDKHHLNQQEIKFCSSNYDKAFGRLHQVLKARNVVREYNEKFVNDFESFKQLCDTFMELPADISDVELKIKEQ